MFRYAKAFSSFSVDDLQQAKEFYHHTLGLEVSENYGLELHLANDNRIFIYPKPDHVPATFTILNFPVDNIEETINQLTKLGVHFLKYEGTMQTDEKGIFHSEDMKMAWFKDPAGNILSVLEEM
jgi:catechol 2,3-dioxygenase-like lactoylglutathione lyase family enzyme